MTKIHGWAAPGVKQKLVPFDYEAGPLAPEDVEIDVEYCGICHSDLSKINSEWGPTKYPFIPGHEMIGKVTALGQNTKGLKMGQRVGIGWTRSSCLHCKQCLSGNHNLCAESVGMIDQYGGFAEKARAQWPWVIPLPEGMDPASSGPLMCGGITVFNPLMMYARPTDRVGIVGVGGLGHMAVMFAKAFGCEVTGFTSKEAKRDEIMSIGADNVVVSTDSKDIQRMAGKLDLLIVTANVPLDWQSYMSTLAPKGRMHVVGVVPQPMPIMAFSLIGGQHAVSGSPSGSPTAIATMLDFAARHKLSPVVEHFPMSKVNEAIAHLAAGKARYRLVLDAEK